MEGRDTYLPFLFVEEVFMLFPAAEKEEGSSNVFSNFCLSGSLLDESSEWGYTGTGADHDNWLRRV